MNAITLNITFNSIDDLQVFMAGRHQPQTAPVFYADPVQADDLSADFDSGNLPDVGDRIHWRGQRFEFDGVVDSVSDGYNAQDSDKAVWVRRNDTGKLVSLTYGDLDMSDNALTAI